MWSPTHLGRWSMLWALVIEPSPENNTELSLNTGQTSTPRGANWLNPIPNEIVYKQRTNRTILRTAKNAPSEDHEFPRSTCCPSPTKSNRLRYCPATKSGTFINRSVTSRCSLAFSPWYASLLCSFSHAGRVSRLGTTSGVS